MAFPVFLDTNSRFNATLCDTLLRLTQQGTFRPQWSAGVLNELRTILIREAGLRPDRADRRIANMRAAFHDAEVTGYEVLQNGLTCHEKDRHVLAAAIRGQSAVLVTFNTKDFPPASTDSFDLSILTPDEFLLDQIDLHEVGSEQRYRSRSETPQALPLIGRVFYRA